MASALATAASSGFHDASAYDAHRPSYPAEAVSAFLDKLQVLRGDGRTPEPLLIVEIGAGTGKFTELLSRQAALSGATAVSIVAVEPHAEMRAQLAAKQLAHVTVVDGHAADLGTVADGTADAVVAAQAFHWFANATALGEMRRVLKPGAAVGVIWNIEDYNKPADWPARTPWEQALNDIVHTLGHDGNPRFRDAEWQTAFAEAADAGLFAPLQDGRVTWAVALAPDALWKRLLTLSQIANLPEAGKASEEGTPTSRAAVRRRVEAVLARDDVARDAEGRVPIHAATYFAWAQKR